MPYWICVFIAWSLSLREEHRLRVFKNRVLRFKNFKKSFQSYTKKIKEHNSSEDKTEIGRIKDGWTAHT
jgi:hypothetical protein